MEIEIWRDIPSYEGLYQVSSLGNVKRYQRKVNMPNGGVRVDVEKLQNKAINKDGYFTLKLSKNGKAKHFKVHQLVAMAFLDHKPCGNTFVVNHKDFDKKNNNISNLEIITQRENVSYREKISSSRFTGVSWDKNNKKWNAYITINRNRKNLGYFVNEIDAHNAYQDALSNLF